MKYQTRYNSETGKAILQVYLYMLDNHQMTYEEFLEITSLSRQSYYIVMNHIVDMIDDLNLKATISKDKRIIKDSNLIEHEANIYYFRQVGLNYYFDLEDCDDEKKIRYSLVIIYLMLKNRQYVSSSVLEKLLPDFNRKRMLAAIECLKEAVAEEIYKNELQSYIIEEE